jgi:hypothetical protein
VTYPDLYPTHSHTHTSLLSKRQPSLRDGSCRASLGANWMILFPRPALARKAATTNRGFSSSTIGAPPSGCGIRRVTAGGGAAASPSIKHVGDAKRKEQSVEGTTEQYRICLFRLSSWLRPFRLLTSIKHRHRIPPAAGNLFKFAHLFRGTSRTFGSHDAKLSLMNRVENLAKEAITTEV